ncbi:hypothetical protein [Asanoa sp. NPDC050611]|uniref:hypothetical protein n=1 Tax=Asanoa sp. NPDC050611 TaxID=3157098 RepID=UPI003407A005
MTRKITISVPDDVAERLDDERNVSAFITDAVRVRMEAEHTRRVLTQLGFDITDEGVAEAKRELDEARAGITPELVREMSSRLAEISGGRWRPRV